MGKYAEILKLLEKSVPEYTSLKVVPRGAPVFPDLLMSGELRFGRRLGANFSVINPDNQVTLAKDAMIDEQVLTLSRILPWFEAGALVSFNEVEMMEIQDWDPSQNTLVVSSPLSANRPSGTKLTLWATPLTVHVTAALGDEQVLVRSRYNLLNGDVLTFPVNELLSSLTQREVTLAEYAGNSGDSEFPHLYLLHLDSALPIELRTTSRIYLRAYPGYLSKVLKVPKLKFAQMGPFLLDYVASPLDSIPSYKEVFSIRTFNTVSVPIEGAVDSLVTVQKNHPVPQRPITADNMVFWQVVRGSGGFATPNLYRMISDKYGKAKVYTRLVPSLPAGHSWKLKVRPQANGLLRFRTFPSGTFQDFVLQDHVTQQVTLTIPPGDNSDRIEILVRLDTPRKEVTLSDANYVGEIVSNFQYGLVLKVIGQTNYQSTSVILKPYFLSFSDVTGNYSEGEKYNSGMIYGFENGFKPLKVTPMGNYQSPVLPPVYFSFDDLPDPYSGGFDVGQFFE
jgi:hypothetical protein